MGGQRFGQMLRSAVAAAQSARSPFAIVEPVCPLGRELPYSNKLVGKNPLTVQGGASSAYWTRCPGEQPFAAQQKSHRRGHKPPNAIAKIDHVEILLFEFGILSEAACGIYTHRPGAVKPFLANMQLHSI